MNLKDNFVSKFVAKKANEASKLAKKILKPVKKFFKTIGVKISITVNGEPQKGDDENSAQRESQEKTQDTKFKDGTQETKTSGEENHGEESSKESEKERKKSDDETINKEAAAEKESEEKPRKEKLSKKKKSLNQEEYAESSSFKQITLTTFLSILDIVASLVFMVAVVVAIKPSLLTDEISKPLYNYSSFVGKIGDALVKIKITESSLPKNVEAAQHYLVGICLVVFGVLKICVLLAAQSGTKKVISVLTLAMTYLAWFLTGDKFLLFLIFVLLLHIIFEYSCGFSSALIFIKLGFVVLASIVVYVVLHFAFSEKLAAMAAEIFEALKLPDLPWW